MPLPPFQTDPRTQKLPEQLAIHPVGSAVLLVTRPEEIPLALSKHGPVLIDIPAFQWRLSLLATVQKWGGKFGWWLFNFLATFLLTQWLNAQLPTKDYLVPDWAKFNFERQPDKKVILRPQEE